MLLPAGLWAQQSGVQLTFGVSQRLEVTGNRTLNADSEGTTVQAVTGLSFGLLSETANSTFRFDTSTSLNAIRDPDGSSGADLLSPRLALRYGHSARNASFDVSASYVESDIAFLRPLTDFVDDTGQILLPDDLDNLNGTGLRRNTNLGGRLSFGDAGPIGLTLRAGYSDTNYVDTSSASLVDFDRLDLGATLRLDINSVTSARVGTTWSRYDNATTPDRITRGVNAGVDIARPNGSVGATISFTDGPDGSRSAFGVTRSLDLPRGTLSGSLGISRDSGDDIALNGGLRYSQQLPNGQFDIALNRAASVSATDAERVTTTLSMGISQALSPISGVSANFDYVDNKDAATNLSVVSASLSINYNRQLTADWGLTAGYRHDLRDPEAGGRADSNSVFVQVGRNFQFRP